jgi:DegV family protein with EDD domain
VSGIAIVTDSASDLSPDLAREAGITVVPLFVSFGDRDYRTGVDITIDEFYERLTAPGAPFPKTAAASPGEFGATFERLLAAGADGVVAVTVGGKLSATLKSAEIARETVGPDRVRVIDSETASMSQGMLALIGVEAARRGGSLDDVQRAIEARKPDSRLYVVLETLEYLRRGGRISGARAAIGGVLSVKPIITVEDGVVETADKPRTRSRARQRLIELLTEEPLERIAVLHAGAPDAEAFADELAQAAGVPRAAVMTSLIGPSVAPHVGPGAYGAAVLRRRATAA